MWPGGCSTLDLKNTIVTGVSSRRSPCTFFTDDPPTCSGTITSLGHNLSSDRSCGFTAVGDLSDSDPKLGPLQDNGGPTFTQALLPGSPAIDAGDDAVVATASTDQRGLPRKRGLHVDIGAYEADGTPTAVCVGDCSGNATVAINDLITLVNIALGNAAPSACPRGVPIGTDVDIALIIRAVGNALSGACDQTPATHSVR